MVLATGATVLLVREEEILFRFVFYNNTLNWLIIPKTDNIEIKLLLPIVCFST